MYQTFSVQNAMPSPPHTQRRYWPESAAAPVSEPPAWDWPVSRSARQGLERQMAQALVLKEPMSMLVQSSPQEIQPPPRDSQPQT